MKIKAWLSRAKKWAAKFLEAIITGGADPDDWWRQSGQFPGD